MPTKITRVVHGTTLYELGKNWPGAEELAKDDLSQLTVGPIFFRPEQMEDVPVPGVAGDPEQGIPSEDPTSITETAFAHYEIWCVTRHVFVAFFGGWASNILGGTFEVDKEKLASAIDRLVVTRRKLPVTKIEFVDEEMPANDAMDEITLRLVELEGGEDDSVEDDEVSDAPAPEAAGNGSQQVVQP